MRFIRNLLRVYSYIFVAIQSLLSLALSAVIFASPHQTLHLGWLPWPDETLGAWLAGLGILGLLLVMLAAAGRLRFLFTIYVLAALVIIPKGLFFSGWHFAGPAELKNALWLTGGLFAAFLGAIPMSSGRPRPASARH